MNPALYIGVWLCAYRFTRIFTKDTLFSRQRNWWFRRFPPDADYGRMYGRSISRWGQLIQCPFCIGFWVSGAVVAVVANFVSMPLPILWWFATSSAVGLTAKRLD